MEIIQGVNPSDLLKASANPLSRLLAKIFPDYISSATIDALKELAPAVQNQKGEKEEVTLKTARSYITRDAEITRKLYPNDARYKPRVEQMRRQVAKSEKDLNDGDFRALIRPFLEKAVRYWDSADRTDARISKLTAEEQAYLVRMYEDAVQTEKEISQKERETGKKQEHGMDPMLLMPNGDIQRLQSQFYVALAVVFANTL